MKKLVLLHGAPGDGSLWQPIVDKLSADVHVICPTLRWFGSGSWPDDGSGFGTAAHTEQLIKLLQAEAGRPCAVAAWSYSTHVLLNALIRRSDLISKAFLYEPGLNTYLRDEAAIEAFNADSQAAFAPVAEALRMHGAKSAVEALFDASGGAGCFRRMPEERRRIYLASARMMPLLMGGGQPPANITAEDLSRIVTPVTVAFGRKTRRLFEIASRAVADAIPGAELRIVDAADHMLPEKEPQTFAALLDEWLKTRG